MLKIIINNLKCANVNNFHHVILYCTQQKMTDLYRATGSIIFKIGRLYTKKHKSEEAKYTVIGRSNK